MPKLENFLDSVEIDKHRYAKNELNYFLNSEDMVSVYYTGQPKFILYQAPYDKWTNEDDIAYNGINALTEDLNSFFFVRTGSSQLEIIKIGNDSFFKTTNPQLSTLIEILEQQTITNKYLRKIYNPE